MNASPATWLLPDRQAHDALRPLTIGLTAFCAGLAVLHLIRSAEGGIPALVIATVSAAAYGAGIWLVRRPMHGKWAEPAACGAIILAVLNVALAFPAVGDAVGLMILGLVGCTAGCVLVARRWMAGLWASIWLAAWGGVSWTPGTARLWPAAACMGLASVAAACIHERRRRLLRHAQQQVIELDLALEQVRAAKRAADHASQAKSEFLARMSHELRTPLNGVLGMADVLRDSNLDSNQRTDLQTLRESAELLLGIIDELLDLSRIETRKIALNPVDCDLAHLLNHLVAAMRPSATQKGLDLFYDIPATMPRRVRVDAQRLRQILFNLLSNAVKFTERGSVRLDVEIAPANDEGWIGRFAVIDTGTGIESATLGRLFQPLVQPDTSRSRRLGNEGLGLTIARQLTDLMGGRIEVRSLLHKSSEFIVELPLHPPLTPEPPPPTPTPTPTPASSSEPARPPAGTTNMAPPPAQRPLKVLVAEDNQANRALAVKFLEHLGHTPAEVSNGLDAVEAATEGAFDAILMDCEMPQLDGLEAARRLRTQMGTRCPYLIAVTANASEEDRRACMEAGMDDYLSKPFSRVVLAEHLLRVP